MTSLNDFDLSKMLSNKLVFSNVDKSMLKAISQTLHYAFQKSTIVDPQAEKTEWLLDNIAIAEAVDFYDRSFNVSQKMLIIKNSDFLKSKKGTPLALERALSNVFSLAEVVEWFNYDGEKGHFKVVITVNGIANEETEKLANKIIEKYKRKSQILDDITFKSINFTATQHMAFALQIAQFITLENRKED